MNGLLMMWILAILPAQTPVVDENGGAGWKTYRSEKYGYELSFPPDMQFMAYFDGSSGDLKDARTGGVLASFEVWPPDQCPRQPEGTMAKEIGIERVKDITQADGHATSSHCGDPLTVRNVASLHDIKIYELELTCVDETFPGSDDDEMDTEDDIVPADTEPTVTIVGKKWPTYFVDISQPWQKRIMTVDPIGNDPRLYKNENRIDMPIVRAILANIKSFAIPKPPGICIEDLPSGTTFKKGVR